MVKTWLLWRIFEYRVVRESVSCSIPIETRYRFECVREIDVVAEYLVTRKDVAVSVHGSNDRHMVFPVVACYCDI